jgi:hypothetical protein
MGNIVGRALHLEDVTRNWPKNCASKKHWCFETGPNPDHHSHYCDDPHVGDPQYDADFDYSVFRCREAKCQTCLDLNRELYPARALWPGDSWIKVDPQSQEIHVTWNSLLESASGGCELCSVLEEGIRLVGGSRNFVPHNVFCVELLEGFTVRVTHEKPVEANMADEKERLVVEFHGSVGEWLFT